MLEIGKLVRCVFHLPEFFLNGLHLLIQVVLALTLLHLLLDAATDAFFDLQHVNFTLDNAEDLFEPLLDVLDLKDALLLGKFQCHVCGDCVREPSRLIDAGERRKYLGRHLLVEFYVLLELGNDRAHQDVDLTFIVPIIFGEQRYFCGKVVGHRDAFDARTLATLDEHLDRAVRQLQKLQNRRQRTDVIQVLGLRIVKVSPLLGDQKDALPGVHRTIKRDDRPLAADEKRDYHMWIDDNVPERQHRNANVISFYYRGCQFFVRHGITSLRDSVEMRIRCPISSRRSGFSRDWTSVESDPVQSRLAPLLQMPHSQATGA